MRKLGIAAASIVIALILAVILAPYVFPTGALQEKARQKAEAATGRKITVEGPVRWAVFPRLQLEMHGVHVANVDGGVAKDIMSLKELVFQLELLPLFSEEIAVDRLLLVEPQIALEIDAQGRPNWQVGDEKTAAKPKASVKVEVTTDDTSGDVRLGDIRLVDGKISYLDRRTNESSVVEHINFRLALASLDQPLSAEGGLTWAGKPIELSLGVGKPRDFISGGESDFSTRLSSEFITAGFKGKAALKPAPSLQGDTDLDIPSLRKLIAWVGKPLPTGDGFGPLAIKGKLALASKTLRFDDAEIRLDEARGKGQVVVDTSGVRPSVQARLDLDKLDLNPYMPRQSADAKPAPVAAPQGKGGDWSDQPIDLGGLKAADADLQLSVGAILAQKISIGRSALAILLKDGRLTADLKEMNLYQGAGSGQMVVDGSGPVPALQAAFKLGKLAAEPFLTDVIGLDRLSGTGAFDVTLASRGKSQRELISALDGKGSVEFLNGAIKGINLAAMLRNIQGAFLDASAGQAQQTDFAQLGGTFTIKAGVLHNDDMALQSPLLRVSGAGTVDLPKREIAYKLTPKLVPSAEGQGGQSKLSGLNVPVLIEGPLDAPKFHPDLAGILEQGVGNPAELLKGLQGSGQTTKPADLLKGLLGGKTP